MRWPKIAVLAAAMGLGGAVAHAETRIYEDAFKGEPPSRATVIVTDAVANVYRVQLSYKLPQGEVSGAQSARVGAGTLNWEFKFTPKNPGDQGSALDIKATRENDKIVVRGKIDGQESERRLAIDAKPWFQFMQTDLAEFALSSRPEIEFWSVGTIGPGRMLANEMRAVRKGDVALTINGKETQAVQVRVGLTGLKSMFWHADLYFSKPDAKLLRYDGSEGMLRTLIKVEP